MNMATSKKTPLVGIIMGSDSDWPTMEQAAKVCEQFNIPHEVKVVSAHRTPMDMSRYARGALKKGLKVIIAGAGGAAHLPGMVASHTVLPVIGVPIESKALKGLDSLLSIAQMPGGVLRGQQPGVPVATVAIGGGKNAGLLAAEILATNDKKLQDKLSAYKDEMSAESRKKTRKLKKPGSVSKDG